MALMVTEWPHDVIAAALFAAVALIHWGVDGWHDTSDPPTEDFGLGFFVSVLNTTTLKPGQRVEFTVRWELNREWLGRDVCFVVRQSSEDEPRVVRLRERHEDSISAKLRALEPALQIDCASAPTTLRTSSATMAWARMVDVLVPSPTASPVFPPPAATSGRRDSLLNP